MLCGRDRHEHRADRSNSTTHVAFPWRRLRLQALAWRARGPPQGLGGDRAVCRPVVGTESADDAAVCQLSETQAVVATTDFFMPIVDEPFDFGRIAATNALSDVYAMGGTPILALALLAMPVEVLPAPVIREILRGGEAICAEAGIPSAGGHSIDSVGADLRARRHRPG
jgi:AIR synthase related protein, N-terminal domain